MKLRILLFFGFMAVMLGCKKQKEYLPPDFNYEIPDVSVTEDVNLGAFYYNYQTTDWNKGLADTPVLNKYNSLDASVMEQHRKWADAAGINFFIFNWDSPTANSLIDNFINNRSQSVKFVINYNAVHLKATNSAPLSGAKLATLKKEIYDLAVKYMSSDSYYKIGNEAVLMFTPLNLPANAANSIDYSLVLPAIKDTLSKIPMNVYLIGEATTGWIPPQRLSKSRDFVDGITLCNWATAVYDQYVFFPSYTDMNWANWRDTLGVTGKTDFIPCLFPAFNDKKLTPTSKNYDFPRTEKFYKDLANVAKRNIGKKRMVIINSWNDFQKGTTFEPTISYGESYLQLTRQFFKKP